MTTKQQHILNPIYCTNVYKLTLYIIYTQYVAYNYVVTNIHF